MENLMTITTSKKRMCTALAVTLGLIVTVFVLNHFLEFTDRFWATCQLSIVMVGLALLLEIDCQGRAKWLLGALLILLTSAWSYTIFQVLYSTRFVIEDDIRMFINLACCTGFYALLYVVIGRLRVALMTGGTLLYVFGLAGYMVNQFRSDVILFPDLFSVKTAMQVASNYHAEINGDIVVGTIAFGALMLWAMKAPDKGHNPFVVRRLRLGLSMACILAGVGFFGTDIERYAYTFEPAANGYPYTFMLSVKMANTMPPAGYETADIAGYMPRHDPMLVASKAAADGGGGISETAGVKPNIIVIMNESFADPSVIGDFQTDRDYMPFIHNMGEDTLKGSLSVSVFGGGTCDSEYSFLTGNTTAFLPENARPYQQYMYEEAPGIVQTLKNQGYECMAIHPGKRSAWNRDKVYPFFGFDTYLSEEDLEPEVLSRNEFISDEDTYAKIIEAFEAKGDAPFFAFGVTIAGHGDYKKDASALEPVYLEGLEGDYPSAEQYLSLMKEGDKEFGELIQYFKYRPEPTVVLMFGDHQGYVEDEFYEEITQKPLSEWSIEDMQARNTTPFVLWSNYFLPSQMDEQISVNYLPSLLLEQVGLHMTDYDRYQIELRETLPVINALGTIDAHGNYAAKGEEIPEKEALDAYEQIVYNNMIDSKNRREALFSLDAPTS